MSAKTCAFRSEVWGDHDSGGELIALGFMANLKLGAGPFGGLHLAAEPRYIVCEDCIVENDCWPINVSGEKCCWRLRLDLVAGSCGAEDARLAELHSAFSRFDLYVEAS